ncbi:MAG: S-layer homology domain-containing protein, partial [Clostridia bacterium]|nr:S-layer homology domain-containing protein [Clostridia bacterium]
MKKLLTFVFVAMLAVTLAVTAFAACDHDFLAMRNMTSHYEECQKCFELRGAGNHTYENGKCTVCGYDEVIMNPFTDVPNDAWYLSDLLSAVSTNLISGKTTTTFAPNDNLTYAEAAKLAACMNQKYVSGEVTLGVGNPWYQTYVDYCKEKNIIRTDYNWSDFATRVGYMYIFACALPDEAYAPINTIDDGAIPDVPMDSPYAAVVYKMYRAGIVTGVDAAHNCNPTAHITRAEVAVI